MIHGGMTSLNGLNLIASNGTSVVDAKGDVILFSTSSGASLLVTARRRDSRRIVPAAVRRPGTPQHVPEGADDVRNRPKAALASDEALNEVADVARKVLIRPGDHLTSVFMLATAVTPDDQLYMQAVMWPPDLAAEIREVLRRFLEGGRGWEGGPSWEEY